VAAKVSAARLKAKSRICFESGMTLSRRSPAASTTASSAQVRQPIYRSSVAKWRRVARQMQPVLARLQAAGIVDADGNPVAP